MSSDSGVDISTPDLPAIELKGDFETLHETLPNLLTAFRRKMHMHPEIGLHEFDTSHAIRDILEMHGLTVQGPIATTGLYTDIVGERTGPTVGYRADIDALPIQDAKSVEYASRTPGMAHLCGHDVHTSIAIGVALLLNQHRSELCGTVRVFFQPNEEGIPSGAPLMIKDGVLEGVKAVYACHVDPTLDVGHYGLKSGPVTASADLFRIRVLSDATGHSARPHQATDTVWIASQIMTVLYQIVGRMTDSRNSAVLSICRLRGGEAYNVIPREVEFGGTFRCIQNDDRQLINDQIGHISKRIGETYGARVNVEYDLGPPAVVNDAALVSVVRDVISENLNEDAIFTIPRPSMGGEDFAHYLQHVPGALIRVGTRSSPETGYVLHDSHFDVDERAMPLTSRIMAKGLMKATEMLAQG